MWQCVMDVIDVLSKIAQTGIAAFGAWLAWRAFLKEDAQEADAIDLQAPVPSDLPDLKIFETSKQTTWLKKTANGIECHLDDRREGKRQGHRWTLSPSQVKEILENGDIYVNPGLKIQTGLVSIGRHTNWLYSKKLFPEPASLHHKVVELMKAASA